MIIGGLNHGLAVDTPIPAPSGWVPMGQIRTGDLIFDERGQVCTVTKAEHVLAGRPCYEVQFSDGSLVTAGADQKWTVDTRRSRLYRLEQARRAVAPVPLGKRRYGPSFPETMTVEAMADFVDIALGTNRTRMTHRNYSVCLASPLCGAHADLPVPPYTLGAWLGDGHARSSAITTADHGILDEIEAENEVLWLQPSSNRDVASKAPTPARICLLADTALRCSPTGKVIGRGLCQTHWSNERRAGRIEQWSSMRQRDTKARVRLGDYTVEGLAVRLRSIGVLGNKHIPAEYLRASEDQRRALLAGLLDTDGYCQKQGTAEYYSTSEGLAWDVHHLVCTLGYNPSLRPKRARLNGKDCGLVWIVRFTTADKVFRLARKLERINSAEAPRSGHRYITAIRPVPTVPVRCIAVDSPSHLFLADSACIPVHDAT